MAVAILFPVQFGVSFPPSLPFSAKLLFRSSSHSCNMCRCPKVCHIMNNNRTKMPALRRLNSAELGVFDVTLYFSGSLNHVSADFPVGLCSFEKPKIKTIPPLSLSQFTKAKKVVRDKKTLRQPISPGAKLASIVSSIFHQTKSKSKSTNTFHVPEPFKDEEMEGHEWGQKRGIRSNGFTSPRLITPKPY